MFSQPAFLIPAAAALALAIAHQVLGWYHFRDEWPRWFRHEPAFSIFLTVFFPVALGILSTLVPSLLAAGLRVVPAVLLWSAGLVLLLLVLILVLQDLNREPFHPYLLKARSAVAVDGALRAALARGQYENAVATLERQALTETLEPGSRDGFIQALKAASALASQISTAPEGSKKRERLVNSIEDNVANAYFALFRPMKGPSDLLARGNALLWTHLLLNVLPIGTAILTFLAVIVTMAEQDPQSKVVAFRSLLIPTTLLVTWFPIRLYSEWYLAFGGYRFLARYQAFILMSVVAVIGIVALVFLAKPDSPEVVAQGVAASLSVVFGGLAFFKPGVFGHVRSAFDRMTIPAYITLALILLIGALGGTAAFSR